MTERRDEVDERLSAFLDGRLSEEEQLELQGALESDEALRADLADLRVTVSALRGLPEIAPPRSFRIAADQVAHSGRIEVISIAEARARLRPGPGTGAIWLRGLAALAAAVSVALLSADTLASMGGARAPDAQVRPLAQSAPAERANSASQPAAAPAAVPAAPVVPAPKPAATAAAGPAAAARAAPPQPGAPSTTATFASPSTSQPQTDATPAAQALRAADAGASRPAQEAPGAGAAPPPTRESKAAGQTEVQPPPDSIGGRQSPTTTSQTATPADSVGRPVAHQTEPTGATPSIPPFRLAGILGFLVAAGLAAVSFTLGRQRPG